MPSHWENVIAHASPSEFWFYICVLVILSGASFFFTFRYLKRARIIDDTPTSKIRSAAQGYVELIGRGQAMDGPAIIAPLTHTPCTWYRYKIEKLSDKSAHTVESGVSDELFFLVGPTGRCVIDPDGAIVTASFKKVWYGSGSEYSTGSTSLWRKIGARYRYTEERLHENEPLYAIGEFKSVGGSNAEVNTREEVKTLLTQWKKDTQLLLQRFDQNKDGHIDVREWEMARKAAYMEVKKSQAERKTEPMVHLLTKPTNCKRPFILSSKSPRELVNTYKLYALGSFAGFLVVGTVVMWALRIRF